MSEWEPATEAEVAMRDALRANDQEQYFRILARTDVLLPVAPDTLPGSDAGWGTWTTDGRTHVLAFTSPAALQECLAGHPGSHRRMPFRDLVSIWPNVDWWLAVNPGLPIEGYLPSWFVTQISRGDVRLPGRTLGARARMEQASNRTRAVAQVPVRGVPNQPAPTPIERHRMRADQAGPVDRPVPADRSGSSDRLGTSDRAPSPTQPPSAGQPAAAGPSPSAGQSSTAGYAARTSQESTPSSSFAPRRDVPPPDVAPPGAFLPTRADRPVNFERSAGSRSTPPSPHPPASAPPYTSASAPPSSAPPSGASPSGASPFAPSPPASVPPAPSASGVASPFAPAPPASVPPRSAPVSPAGDAPRSAPPAAGPPTSGAPAPGAGPARGRAVFPGSSRRGLFDDSDRMSLDVPGERELFAELDREPPARADLPSRPSAALSNGSGFPPRGAEPPSTYGQPPSPRPQGSSGLPSRPLPADQGSGLPSRPFGGEQGAGLPSRPSGGEPGSGLPAGPFGGEQGSGLPARPPGGLPARTPDGAEPGGAGLPPRFAGSTGSGQPDQPRRGEVPDDVEGDPRRYWPRREPASSLGEIFTEHAEPVIPAAWQPPPDLPRPSTPPLPTRQPQGARPEPETPAAFRPGEGGPLPGRSGAGSPLPSRPGEPAFGRGEPLPPRTSAAQSHAFSSDEPAEPAAFQPRVPLPPRSGAGETPFGQAAVVQPGTQETQPIRSGWDGSSDVRPGSSGLPSRFADTGRAEVPSTFRPAEAPPAVPEPPPWRTQAEPPAAPLPFDRPVFDRPGFSRIDIENPEIDEAPVQGAAPSSVFGSASSGALAGGFGQTPDLDQHPFFADEADVADEPAVQEPEPRTDRPFVPQTESSSFAAQVDRPFEPYAERPFEARVEPPVEAPVERTFESFSELREALNEPRSYDSLFEPRTEPRTDSRTDPPITDPYAVLAELRSEPLIDAPIQASFASGVDSLAETRPEAPVEAPVADEPRDRSGEFRTGSFFGDVDGSPGTAEPAFEESAGQRSGSFFAPGATVEEYSEPSPELRSFFETGAAERASLKESELAQSAEIAGSETGRIEEAPAYSWTPEPESREAEPEQVPEPEPEPESREPYQPGKYQSETYQPAAYQPEPYQPEPYQPEPYQPESFQPESFPAEPFRAELFRAEPFPAETYQAETYQAESYQSESFGAEPATYHVEPTREPTREPVYEPEIVDNAPIRLHDEIVDAEVVVPVVTAETSLVEVAPVGTAAAPVASAAPVTGRDAHKNFKPANTVEKDLVEAVQANNTDRFLSTLLLAKIIVPFWTGDGPVEPANWRTEHMNGLPHLVVFTSQERMTERLGPDARGSWIKFTRLIRHWPPGDQLAFAINPESPAGAVLPGTEVVQLATWATELGLGVDEPEDAAGAAQAAAAEQPRPTFEPPAANGQLVMQKPISPEQLSHYLERNYDRVSGFVHRASEVAHLQTPEQLYNALGLGYVGSSFKPDAEESYVLRWIAYRGDLYRIPYGGSSPEAMRAMEGWVIERPPFRGNGFAPSETNDVIAEFKVDSARLPHDAELWRLRRDGRQDLIARLDSDGPAWRKTGAL